MTAGTAPPSGGQALKEERIVAIVRPPTAALRRCEITHIEREPIDVPRAVAQHAGYADLLRQLGAEVIVLPPEPDLPDAVFVEDTAVVLAELAIITNPGAASRRPETRTVAAALQPFRRLHRMRPPATLDGGDVIIADRSIYVGRSSRTNDDGIADLAASVEPFGYRVHDVALSGCLHLKSACTFLGDGTFLLNPAWVDPAAFPPQRRLRVPESEPRAANTFRVGDTTVMADAFPLTRQTLEDSGFRVRTADLSELQKAEAGGSCMSLIFRVRSGDRVARGR
jgi:dimethylargininase